MRRATALLGLIVTLAVAPAAGAAPGDDAAAPGAQPGCGETRLPLVFRPLCAQLDQSTRSGDSGSPVCTIKPYVLRPLCD